MNFEEIKEAILTGIPDAQISIDDLTGTGDHLGITVTSPIFSGKKILEQHRLVMDLLKVKLETGLHAVKIKTKTS